MWHHLLAAVILVARGAGPAAQPAEAPSRIADDERVVLFPTLATRDGEAWRVRVHGWIYEPEEDSDWRRRSVAAFADALGLDAEERASEDFQRRALRFIADNERGKRIGVSVAGRTHVLAPSGADGHFRGELTIASADVPADAGGWLGMEVAGSGERSFRGAALLAGPGGFAVISDIDDTLRVSEVGDTERLLRRTLVEPPEAVPGMADLLCRLAGGDGTVHYVTGSPWQLYEDVAAFLEASGCPRGTFHMRGFRFKEESALAMLGSPAGFKAGACRELLEALPERRFVLVGDTSEDDASVYAGLAREFPGRVTFVAIRVVPGAAGGEDAARDALDGLPAGSWAVFRDPGEVDAARARRR